MSTRRTPGSPPTPGSSAPPKAAVRVPRAKQSEPAVAADRVEVSAETRHAMIAQAAYLRSQQRGFAPGAETEDWLAAERAVDALLTADHGRSAQ